jgi:hypothetical protein
LSLPVEDAVERQVRAYNAHDLDAFIDCYADGVVVEDADGGAVMKGREEMRQQYGKVFAAMPNLHAEIVQRIRVGSYVVDEERVSGRPDGRLRAVAIYRLDGQGLIDRVRFMR